MKCKYCGKETRRSKITGKELEFCCNSHRSYLWRKQQRIKRKSQHKCIDCGIKLKPIIVYRIRCPKHLEKLRKSK